MLVGQQLGPFLIEKELGAGAMGAVYRGKYVETGQVVAVKVMAPGLGTRSDAANKRFEREANILKQLRHPNIVRLFGVGKFRGTAYYAMEYVQGESLDKVMSRRDRMTWEEVVDLGQQLCAALQHAHEKGIIHRDLKPSNLMILPEGTLKLTDFGIAKDIDVTALTGANNTIGTASYMSPEQCRGDPNISYKSDLYSLGVVFYELITGRKPFIAENAMDLFMMHVNGTFERPSRIVLDLPVWMDNLICQLLEKKPEHRPRDAAMVLEVLNSIQEKVEAQQSAGMDVAKARLMDRPRGQRNPGEEDREVARTLLGKKGKRKKKDKKKLVWLQAAGLLFLLAGIITTLVIVFQPPSANSLYKKAEKLMASGDPDKRSRAIEGPIKEYLARYGGQDNQQTRQIRAWADEYEVDRYEKLLQRYIRHEKLNKGLAVEARTDSEGMAFKAGLAEYDGDVEKARKLWAAVIERDRLRVGLLAQKHLETLDAIAGEEKRLLGLRKEVRDKRAEPKLEGLAGEAFLGLRQELLGDRLGARVRYKRMNEEAAQEVPGQEAVQRFWLLFSAARIKQMDESLKKIPQQQEDVVKLVKQKVEDVGAALKQKDVVLLDLWAIVHDIEVLYAKNDSMTDVVKQAKEYIKEIDARLPKRGS
jgi:serine/threonine protein kinase